MSAVAEDTPVANNNASVDLNSTVLDVVATTTVLVTVSSDRRSQLKKLSPD